MKQWLRERYAPDFRYQMIAADLIMLIAVAFAIPALFIVWRILWRAALSC